MPKRVCVLVVAFLDELQRLIAVFSQFATRILLPFNELYSKKKEMTRSERATALMEGLPAMTLLLCLAALPLAASVEAQWAAECATQVVQEGPCQE